MSPNRNDPAPAIGLSHPSGARAAVYPDGAHLFTWWPSVGSEVLFVSARAARQAGTPLRGGVPVIFPQFADEGPLPKHGFARTTRWETLPRDTMTVLAMRLGDGEATREVWPHRFEAEYTVTLTDHTVDMALGIENRGEAPFAFTCALHTYLRVGDVAAVALEGLQGCRYRDTAAGGAEAVEEAERLVVNGEVDRIYFDTPAALRLHDTALGRTIAIGASGFTDTVVWNPGEMRAGQLPDLEVGEHRSFVCVESARVGTSVALGPGERWVGRQTLSV